MTIAPERPAPARPAVTRPAAELLTLADRGLTEAARATRPTERYATAHLAALRSAAAVLACRAAPGEKRGRPTSAWVLLAAVAPELGEWAAFFAQGARTRAAAEAGRDVVTSRQADDLLRDAQAFRQVAEQTVLAGLAGEGTPGATAYARFEGPPDRSVTSDRTATSIGDPA